MDQTSRYRTRFCVWVMIALLAMCAPHSGAQKRRTKREPPPETTIDAGREPETGPPLAGLASTRGGTGTILTGPAETVVLYQQADAYVGDVEIAGDAQFRVLVIGDLILTLKDGQLSCSNKPILPDKTLNAGQVYRIVASPVRLQARYTGDPEGMPRLTLTPIPIDDQAKTGDRTKAVTVAFALQQPSSFVTFLRANLVYLLAALGLIVLASGVLIHVLMPARRVGEEAVSPVTRLQELVRRLRVMAQAAGAGYAASSIAAPRPAAPPPDPVVELRTLVGSLQAELQRSQETYVKRQSIEELRESFEGHINRLDASLGTLTTRTDQQLEDLHSALRELQTTLKQVKEASGGYWPLIFSDALNSDPQFQKEAQEAQQRLIEFFRNAVPGGDGLAELSTNTRALQQALRKTVEWTSGAYPASSILPRLAALEEAVGELCRQTDVMRDNLADRRLRLRFDFTLPCFPGARQNIFDGLTTGLTAEVAKWQDPVAYLSARLEELCITAAPLAADLFDRETDSQRSNSELQALLRELFATAGLQEIVVKQRQAFQPAYHSVVQIVPGRSPEDQSQTVAQLAARGFLRRGEVLRKASVVLYK